MLSRFAGFKMRESLSVRLGSFLYLMAIAYLISSGAEWVSMGEPALVQNVVRFLHYSLTTLLVIFLAPWALSRMGLSRPVVPNLAIPA